MRWAIKDNKRVEAEPKLKAICPICNEEVISKCGLIKVWHWSHKSISECDNWSEPESEWHLQWKNEFPKECQEFIMGKHRADIRTKDRYIIELQNSPISSEKIIERENYYKRMIWLLNGEKLFGGLELRKKGDIFTFRFKSPTKSWEYASKPLYIHLNGKMARNKGMVLGEENGHIISYMDTSYDQVWDGSEIFLIKKIYYGKYCGGWGKIISKEDFLKKFK